MRTDDAKAKEVVMRMVDRTMAPHYGQGKFPKQISF
jgi:hypothetical protein